MEKTTGTNTNRYQYQEILDTLGVPCPPPSFRERETEAFRWVFGTMEDERNFLPQYVKNPPRFAKKPDHEKCLPLGLSFFDTAENATKRFEEMKSKLSAKLVKEAGSHLSHGRLMPEYGVGDSPGMKGHFTFYPHQETHLAPIFSITNSLW